MGCSIQTVVSGRYAAAGSLIDNWNHASEGEKKLKLSVEILGARICRNSLVDWIF